MVDNKGKKLWLSPNFRRPFILPAEGREMVKECFRKNYLEAKGLPGIIYIMNDKNLSKTTVQEITVSLTKRLD